MSHTLFRLTESLLSEPLLMTESSCQNILSYLDLRNNQSLIQLTQMASDAEKKVALSPWCIAENGVGTINIFGALTTNKTGFEALCGNTSYEGIVEKAKTLFSSQEIHTVLLNIRSGGGSAHKSFETSRLLSSLAKSSGKRLIAYVDEMAASAAYALAVSADEIVINPTAQAGSIGVLIRLANNSQQLKNEGIEQVFITSCDGKVPFNSEGEFREEYISDLQDKVSLLYEDFINHVAEFRGLEPKLIRDTNAGVFSAETSLQLGLVDKIMDTEEFYTYLADIDELEANEDVTVPPKEDPIEIKPYKKDKNCMTDLSIDPSAFAELQAQMKQQAEMLAAYQAKELQLEKEALLAKFDTTPFLAECKEQLAGFFMSKDVGAEYKELMNSVIASAQASNESILTEAANQVTTAQEKVTAAEAEAEKVKAEFSTTVHSVQAELKEPASGKNILEEKIARLKAAQQTK